MSGLAGTRSCPPQARDAAVRLLDILLRLRQRAAEHGDLVAMILLDQRIRAALA